eukprot:8742501-Pyramimonas_sp.AAC.1
MDWWGLAKRSVLRAGSKRNVSSVGYWVSGCTCSYQGSGIECRVLGVGYLMWGTRRRVLSAGFKYRVASV